MDNVIAPKSPIQFKVNKWALSFFLIAILIGTFLRISLLVIYPLVFLFIFLQLRLRVSKYSIVLLGLIGLSLFLSFFSGWYIKYKLLSLYYMLPFIFLLFSNPGKYLADGQNLVSIFFKCLSVIATVNNIIGVMQVIRNPTSDDSFIGIYSTYSISMGGLVILNMVLFAYYFYLYMATKRKKRLWISLFFLASCVMGFYGGGLVAFVIAFILTFFRLRFSAIIKSVFISLISIAAIYYALAWLKPSVLRYNIANIKKVVQFDLENGPRKVIAFHNYGVAYPSNIKDFLFGSGPGTFNSRSAFMVGSPSFFTAVPFLKSGNQPYYFREYAYTLWNETNTSQALFQDGFRNQPFSSLLAFLGEYGFLFTLFFGWFYYRHYRQITTIQVINAPPEYAAYRKLLKFLFIFLLLLLCMDNFYEYPEIMLLILIVIKLMHVEITKMSRITA